MKPRPFRPELLEPDGPYVRDRETGLVWHRCSHRPLYADTDRSAVVYHANYLRYFELGRTSLMRDAAYPYREIEDSGYLYPVIELGVTYSAALYYDDPMHIFTRPADLERVKLTFHYTITHVESGETACQGFTQHCALNAKRQPVGIDQKTIELWKSFPRQEYFLRSSDCGI